MSGGVQKDIWVVNSKHWQVNEPLSWEDWGQGRTESVAGEVLAGQGSTPDHPGLVVGSTKVVRIGLEFSDKKGTSSYETSGNQGSERARS